MSTNPSFRLVPVTPPNAPVKRIAVNLSPIRSLAIAEFTEGNFPGWFVSMNYGSDEIEHFGPYSEEQAWEVFNSLMREPL